MKENTQNTGLSAFGIAAIVILLGLLVWAGWYAITAWIAMRGVAISTLGWVFMGLGAVVTLLLGAGLMALVFYSSRHDMDR